MIKDLLRRAVLYEFAEVEENHVVREPHGLPQDMRDDHYGVVLLELEESFLDTLA